MALFFEERTLDFSKKYQKSYQKDKTKLDLQFWQVHYFHMKDEIRHHQMDEIFLDAFYNDAASWKRKLCGYLFYKLMKAYLAPKRNAKNMLRILESEFPELKDGIITDKIRQELPLLETHEEFQEVVFGRHAIGRTLELMARYTEFDKIWSLFINTKKEDFIKK